MASRGVPAELIWGIRVQQLEAVLATPPWVRVAPACRALLQLTRRCAQRDGFTIWNAGKEGKRLYKSLSAAARAAVRAFADVDARKIAQGAYDDVQGRRRVPILHFRCAEQCAGCACVSVGPLTLCTPGVQSRRCCCA